MRELKFINHKDPFLEKVITLGKRNSSTLGLMPRDAYVEQSRKRCIVIVFENDELIGYCLFRTTSSKNRISITQVCVDTKYKGQGVARMLLDIIQEKYKHQFAGMLVSCREDYQACHLWESYGFVKETRVRSRSIEEHYLIKFWFDFGQPNLFTSANDFGELNVVLDLNIFIKLKDKSIGHEEISFLFSDWLIDEVDYYYAKETLNEIHRDRDFERTNSTRQYLKNFKELSSNPKESQKYLPELETLHSGKSQNHISDRKQLAECKACGIQYFITLDEEMLSNADLIYEKFGMSILRPSVFILEIDELKNKLLYEPVRLHGAQYEVKRPDSQELLVAIDQFFVNSQGEKKNEFRNMVSNTISDLKNSSVKIVISPKNEYVCFFGYRCTAHNIVVEFIRLDEKQLQNTLFSQILTELIKEALHEKKTTIEINEKNLTDDFSILLIRQGFFKSQEAWFKLVLKGLCSLTDLSSIHPVVREHNFISDILDTIDNLNDDDIKQEYVSNLERKLWPLKFDDLDLPIFIVPIKPYWASQLFDFISANESLFGAVPQLTWSRENVYYRSVNPNVESFPARILWYASEQKGFQRQKAIVACSYLNNVTIGEAKKLFSIFKRFGIYEWREIFKLAKKDIKTSIKALQFSDTEVFDRPVEFNAITEILLDQNLKRNTFMSPVRVPREVFNRVYKKGKQ